MLNRIADFLCGWRTVTVPAEETVRVFDDLYRNTVPFTKEHRLPDGTITIRVRGSVGKYLGKYDACTVSEPHGLPVVLAFLRFRPALVLGVFAAAGWLFYSTRIIWDVRIEGAQKTSPEAITELLAELGCGIGDYIPSIDFNDLHSKYAAAQHDIAWLSVYMNGTVAEVQVRELWADDRQIPPEGMCANVLADADGIVEEVNVREGQARVRKGDLVRKGQVLISGIIEQKDGTFRYEYASGEVICRTAQPIHTEIRTRQDVKVYTGRETAKKSIKFFKKTINLFVNSGTLYTNYDKIYTIEQLCPLGLCELPVWLETTVYREYETVTQDIPPADAADEAMAELAEKMRTAMQSAELVSKSIDAGFADGAYKIDCLLYLRRDIGRTEEFSALESCVPDSGNTP